MPDKKVRTGANLFWKMSENEVKIGAEEQYSASSIQVLEGLEAVRRLSLQAATPGSCTREAASSIAWNETTPGIVATRGLQTARLQLTVLSSVSILPNPIW